MDDTDIPTLGNFHFSFSSIMAAFIFGVVGFYLLKESRKVGNIYWAIIGILMMAYPMFTPNAWFDWGIGIALSIAAYWFR